MSWTKLGRVFSVEQRSAWAHSHAQLPTPILLDDKLRVYLMVRDMHNQSRVGYVDLDPGDLMKKPIFSQEPALDLGTRGAFDDAGVAPSCVVQRGDALWLYFIGTTPRKTVALDYALGVAVSHDGGRSFERLSDGPILAKCTDEPYLITSPQVIPWQDGWRMYYTAGTGWADVDGRDQMIYEVRYRDSSDGIHWSTPTTAISPQDPEEATTRPWVVQSSNGWNMWFCHRERRAFPRGRGSFRIGTAHSSDGHEWIRDDDPHTLAPSSDGFDSKMTVNPALADVPSGRYLFYNGNGFGQEGFGVAAWHP